METTIQDTRPIIVTRSVLEGVEASQLAQGLALCTWRDCDFDDAGGKPASDSRVIDIRPYSAETFNVGKRCEYMIAQRSDRSPLVVLTESDRIAWESDDQCISPLSWAFDIADTRTNPDSPPRCEISIVLIPAAVVRAVGWTALKVCALRSMRDHNRARTRPERASSVGGGRRVGTRLIRFSRTEADGLLRAELLG